MTDSDLYIKNKHKT